MHAATYARLSLTKDSSEPNLDYQHSRNIEFLQSLGYTVAEDAIYSEPLGHRSGRFIEQRHAMQKLQRDIAKYKGGAIGFFDFSRFARNAQFAFEFIAAASKLGVKLFNTSTREQITLDNASAFLKTGIEALFAEYESRKGTERMTNAYTRAKKLNYISARAAPSGLALTGSLRERQYIKDKEFFPTTLAFFKLVAKGKSIRAAALEIQKRGMMARGRAGAVKFDLHQAYNLKLRFDRFKPFLDASLYRQVAVRFAETSTHHKRGRIPLVPGILAYGLLRCALCGSRFHARTERPHPELKKYIALFYQHSNATLCKNDRKVVRHKLESQLWDVLDRIAARLAGNADFVGALTVKPVAPTASRRSELQAQLATLESNFHAIVASANMSPAIAESFNNKRDELERELNTLKEEIEIPPLSHDDMLAYAASASTWRVLAREHPEQFNVMLKDMFESITVDTKNHLEFHPVPDFAGWL